MQRVAVTAALGLFGTVLVPAQPMLHLKSRVSAGSQFLAFSAQQAEPKRLSPGRHHIVIQFAAMPGLIDLKRLESQGVVVLQYVPDQALMVNAPDRLSLDGSKVILAEALMSADKISPDLDPPLGSLAELVKEDGEPRRTAVVELYPDVSAPMARQIATQEGIRLLEHADLSPHNLLIEATAEQMRRLGEWDEVAYIYPASPELARAEHVHDPCLDHVGECPPSRSTGAEIQHEVEGVAALGIGAGGLGRHHVEGARARIAEDRHQWRGPVGHVGAVDGFLVGQQQGAVLERQALRTKQEFGGPPHERIGLAIEHRAGDQMHELIEEQRRRRHALGADQRQIGRVQRWMRQQTITKGRQVAPVLAGVAILEGTDIGGGNRRARGPQQSVVQSALGVARIIRRHDLGPRQIGLEEFVGDAANFFNAFFRHQHGEMRNKVAIFYGEVYFQ